MDINPVNPGHVLTVTRRHAIDIWDRQTVFHVHMHSIPRWADDAWIDPWSPAPGDADATAEVAQRIRSAAIDA